MKLVSFGEIMLRLTPPGYTRLRAARSLTMFYGGAEANVAAMFAACGGQAAFVTVLPDGPLGDGAAAALRAAGVDTSGIRRRPGRLGVYYLERGAAQRPSDVVYDRAGSAVAVAPGDLYDWDALLAGADWFFFTGITAALGEGCRAALSAAIAAARRQGVRIACDVNYRQKLWTAEEAGAVMRPLVKGIDLLVVNEEHATRVLGIPSGNVGEDFAARRQNAARMAADLSGRYGIPAVAMTLRSTISAEETMTGAVLRDGSGVYDSPDYRMKAVDRVGSGDAYSGGLLYALCRGDGAARANAFGAAACALKHSMEGDIFCGTAAEVDRLSDGGGSRIQR